MFFFLKADRKLYFTIWMSIWSSYGTYMAYISKTQDDMHDYSHKSILLKLRNESIYMYIHTLNCVTEPSHIVRFTFSAICLLHFLVFLKTGKCQSDTEARSCLNFHFVFLTHSCLTCHVFGQMTLIGNAKVKPHIITFCSIYMVRKMNRLDGS